MLKPIIFIFILALTAPIGVYLGLSHTLLREDLDFTKPSNITLEQLQELGPGPILDSKGALNESGWSTKSVRCLNRENLPTGSDLLYYSDSYTTARYKSVIKIRLEDQFLHRSWPTGYEVLLLDLGSKAELRFIQLGQFFHIFKLESSQLPDTEKFANWTLDFTLKTTEFELLIIDTDQGARYHREVTLHIPK